MRGVRNIEHAPKGVLDVFDMRGGEEHVEHAPKGVLDVLRARHRFANPCG